jgi:hypothetical protein
MTAARRLAAIMDIDGVGYSRLMGEDEGIVTLAEIGGFSEHLEWPRSSPSR